MSAVQSGMYQLAENLGMTVTRMSREMTMSEYFGWLAFYTERAEQEKNPKKPKAPQKNSGVVMRGFDI